MGFDSNQMSFEPAHARYGVPPPVMATLGLEKMMNKTAITVLGLCLIAQVCPAPIYSGFPGIPALVERADTIAVARLVKPHTLANRIGQQEFDAHFHMILKGDKPTNRLVRVSLRYLPYDQAYTGFSMASCYLLFLRKSTNEEAMYTGLNTEGDSWELSPSPKLSDLSLLSTENAISHLLRESAEHKRKATLQFSQAVGKALSKKENPTNASTATNQPALRTD